MKSTSEARQLLLERNLFLGGAKIYEFLCCEII